MKSALTPIGKSALLLFGLSAGMAATDTAIRKRFFGSGTITINSNKELEDLMKVVKSFEESRSLIKGTCETLKNEVKVQKGGFFRMLLDTLAASLLESALTGHRLKRAGEETNKASQNF